MRKLLGLISAVALIGTSASAVVACGDGNNRISASDAKLNPDYILQTIFKILGGSDNLADLGISLGDIFSSGDITTIATNLINEAIAQDNYKNNIKYQEKQLGVDVDHGDDEEEWFKNNFAALAEQVAEDKFYSDYTKSLNSNDPLDYSIRKQGYSLNPSENLATDENGTAFEGTAVIRYIPSGGSTPQQWQTLFENSNNDEKYKEQIPEGTDLADSDFEVTDSSGTILYALDSKTSTYKTLENLSGKEILKWRFQDYFVNKVEKDVIENLLTVTYEMGSMYNFRNASGSTTKEAYLNKYSPVASSMQTWSTTSTEWTSNMKMVWQLYVPVEQANSVINSWSTLAEDKWNVKPYSGEIKDQGETKIGTVISGITDSVGEDNISTNSGLDPYFNQKGFKGFIATKDSEIYGYNMLDDDIDSNLKTAIINQQNPGVVMNGVNNPFYPGRNTGERVITIVLPIYLIDILSKDVTVPDSTFEVEDGHGVKLGPNSANENQYWNVWNQNQNLIKHSADIEGLNHDQRASLLAQMQYMVSQDTTVASDAKTVLYTSYLDADDILLQELYDSIGQYIKEDE